MKKVWLFLCVLLLIGVVCSPTSVKAQASKKQYTEIYNLNVPLGIKVVAGDLIYRADSGFWMIADSSFAKTDSGITMVRRGGTRFHFLTNTPFVKYSLSADTASTTLRNGTIRVTTKYLWIRVNGTWKKITLS